MSNFKTVNQVIADTGKTAHKQLQALSDLVKKGLGDCLVTTYGGWPYATHGSSNAAKCRKHLKAQGFEVFGEAAGPARRYKSEGNLVFVAFKLV